MGQGRIHTHLYLPRIRRKCRQPPRSYVKRPTRDCEPIANVIVLTFAIVIVLGIWLLLTIIDKYE